MGLDRPTSGTVTVNGKPYRQHRAPLREVGALLEASAVHPGRSARSHLRSMAATHNIKASRVSEVIEMTGLAGVATKRVAGFSLGMGQRLGIAAALLGDPGRSSSTSRSTGSTPRACSGSASSCAPWAIPVANVVERIEEQISRPHRPPRCAGLPRKLRWPLPTGVRRRRSHHRILMSCLCCIRRRATGSKGGDWIKVSNPESLVAGR